MRESIDCSVPPPGWIKKRKLWEDLSYARQYSLWITYEKSVGIYKNRNIGHSFDISKPPSGWVKKKLDWSELSTNSKRKAHSVHNHTSDEVKETLRKSNKKPKSDKRKISMRKCLKCRKSFKSQHNTNRICLKCKDGNKTYSGLDYGFIYK